MPRRPPLALRLSGLLALALLSMASVCDEGPLPPAARSLLLAPAGPITVEVGEAAELRASVIGVPDPAVTFISSNPTVATVASDEPLVAVVRGIAAGDATISAVVEDVELLATLAVSVVEPPPPPPPIVEVVVDGVLRLAQDAMPPRDEEIFDAGDGVAVRLRLRIQASAVGIEGIDGFQPSGLPSLNGQIDADGAFMVDGKGAVAGVEGIGVLAEGTFAASTLTMSITVGADGALPGGEPVIYELQGEEAQGAAP